MRSIDQQVSWFVEILRVDVIDTLTNRRRRQQHRTEYALLGIFIRRRLTELPVALRVFQLITLTVFASATAVIIGRIACFGDIERLRRRLFRRQVVIVVDTRSEEHTSEL